MPYEGDVKMPCGRVYYCGRNDCPNAKLCRNLREGLGYRAGNKSRPGWNVNEVAEDGQSGIKKTSRPLAEPSDIVYLYDGSLAGFYCCVYECVYSHQLPCAIWTEVTAQPSMYRQLRIETRKDKAQKVEESIPKKISERAMNLVQTVFLSCLEEKELAILRFLLLGYQVGAGVAYLFGHEDVKPILAAEKHLGGEAHLLKGFVRFSDYEGVLAANISPKNFVLPFLEEHFVTRYPNENFMIYDKTHKAALIYENKSSRIIPLEGIEFPQANEKEELYRALWKRFYNTIAIEARTNPKCRMTLMPKRYWENMLEVADLL